ncbi:hypothetical protein TI83_05495 [Rathayibacter toxicus]|nr:hypothetical protein TI83_05495 [Rathayibacter toxicus]
MRTRTESATLALMLALTVSTGIIDAVGYLGLDRVFAGNMTGNVVILGMAFSGATTIPVAGPTIALGGFIIGAFIGGRVLRPIKQGWTSRTSWLFSIVSALLAALAVLLVTVPESQLQSISLLVTGVLGAAMGLQAATARHLGVIDITTVVVTTTITSFFSDCRLAGSRKQPWFRRGAAIFLICLGGAVGALALLVGLWLGLTIAAAITLIATLLGELIVHIRHAPARKPV